MGGHDIDFTKRHQVGLRLDDEELARLRELSAKFGLRLQQTVRMALKRMHDECRGTAT